MNRLLCYSSSRLLCRVLDFFVLHSPNQTVTNCPQILLPCRFMTSWDYHYNYHTNYCVKLLDMYSCICSTGLLLCLHSRARYRSSCVTDWQHFELSIFSLTHNTLTIHTVLARVNTRETLSGRLNEVPVSLNTTTWTLSPQS